MRISFTAGLIKYPGYNKEPVYINPNNITLIKGNTGNKDKCWVDTVNNVDGPYIEINAPASAVADAFHRAQITGRTAVVHPDKKDELPIKPLI